MLANEHRPTNPETIPERLYSYCRSEHLRSFLSTGEIRIGTLYGFRDTEAHGNQIGDEEEGTLTRNEEIDYSRGSELSDFSRRIFNVADNVAESARFVDVEVSIRESSVNYYIFCVSESSSWADGRKMSADYDARIVIQDPLRFFGAIARCMAERIKKQWYIAKCEYGGKSIDYRDSVHPAILKSVEFAYQQEHRLLMEPTFAYIQPEIIKCPTAVQFCSGQINRSSGPPFQDNSVEDIPREPLGFRLQHGGSSRGRKKRSKPARHKRKD